MNIIMKLNTQYLAQRHAYWLASIAEAGIWEPVRFRPVVFAVRPRIKSYMGLFQRKWVTMNGIRKLTDFIIIYYHPGLSPAEIDNILVHEMIHQYIFQSSFKDTSSHGTLFRSIMNKINRTFPSELKISVRGEYSAPDNRILNHSILLLRLIDNTYYCCKIREGKIEFFLQMIDGNPLLYRIREYRFLKSAHPLFNTFRACTSRLHGKKMTISEMKRFCEDYGIEADKKFFE